MAKSVLEILQAIREGDIGYVTYFYDDGIIVDVNNTKEGGYFKPGSIQSSMINKQVFYTERGSLTPLTEVLKVFRDTVWDRGAKRFEISI